MKFKLDQKKIQFPLIYAKIQLTDLMRKFINIDIFTSIWFKWYKYEKKIKRIDKRIHCDLSFGNFNLYKYWILAVICLDITQTIC